MSDYFSYLGTIQCLYGFFPLSLSVVEVVLGSFARYALHIHMYDYLGAIQCQSGVFPNFAFNGRGHPLGRFQGTLIKTFLTI